MLGRRFRYTQDTLQSYRDALEAQSNDGFRNLLKNVSLSHTRLCIAPVLCEITLSSDAIQYLQHRTDLPLDVDQARNEKYVVTVPNACPGDDTSVVTLEITVIDVADTREPQRDRRVILTATIDSNDRQERFPLLMNSVHYAQFQKPNAAGEAAPTTMQDKIQDIQYLLTRLSPGEHQEIRRDAQAFLNRQVFNTFETLAELARARQIHDELTTIVNYDNRARIKITQTTIKKRLVPLQASAEGSLNSLQQSEKALFEMFANFSLSQYQRDISRHNRPKKRMLNGGVLPRLGGGGNSFGDAAQDTGHDARLLHYELRDHVHGNDYWKRKAVEIVMKYMLLSTEVETRLPATNQHSIDRRRDLYRNVMNIVRHYQAHGNVRDFDSSSFVEVDVSGVAIGSASDRAKRSISNWAGWFTSEISADAHILSAGIRIQYGNDPLCKLMGLRFSDSARDVNRYSSSTVTILPDGPDDADGPDAVNRTIEGATAGRIDVADREWARAVEAYNELDTQLSYRGLETVFKMAVSKGLSHVPLNLPVDDLLVALASDSIRLLGDDGDPVDRPVPLKLIFDPLLPLLRHCGFNVIDDRALVVPMMVNLRGHNAEFAQGRVVSATLMMIDHPQLLQGTSLYERCKSLVRSAWRLQTGYEDGLERNRKFRRVIGGGRSADAELRPDAECYNIVADAIMAQFHAIYPPGTSVEAPTRFRIVDSGTRRLQTIEALALCDKGLYKTIDVLLSPSDSQSFKDFCKAHSHTANIDSGILRLRPVFPSKDEEMHHLETVGMIYNVPTYDMDESGRWYIGAELDDFMEGMMMYRKVRR